VHSRNVFYPKNATVCFDFVFVGLHVAVSSTKDFSVAMEAQKWCHFVLLSAAEYFVLLLTTMSIKHYKCVCVCVCVCVSVFLP
jgi:hypothetical protein